MRELTVDLGQRSYPIYIGEGILRQIGPLFIKHGLTQASPVLVVTDDKVGPIYLDAVLGELEKSGYKTASVTVPSGETSKSLERLNEIVTAALEAGLDRSSAIVALGGGVVGDLAGFAAASFMRGIRFVQIPTTILAHDSSVGGKVAVNHRLAKNIIGAFHQPEFVLYDIATLRTLPEREIRAGLAEVIKHGLILDAEFAAWCDEHADQLLALESEALQHAIHQGCKIKAIVVSQDEREGGLRAILNLGHTIGHALEAVANYNELLHGEAISIGMVGSAKLALKLGHPEHIYHTTKRLLGKFGLPTRLPGHLATDDILSAMMHDKKFREGRMAFVIPTDIGRADINVPVPSEWVREVVDQLRLEA